MTKSRILLVEDDPNLAFVIEDHLTESGFEAVVVDNGVGALEKFKSNSINLCLVDVMMPRMDGFTLASEIRKLDEFVPILFLTARSMEEDRLKGFEIGGDDYITKPFSMPELIHRIKVFLRRSSARPQVSERKLKLGKLLFDDVNLTIFGQNQQALTLTQMEADLLLLLMQHINQLVKREEILVKIWGENDYFKGRSLDVFISRLRKYLKADPDLEIKNHHGVGFTLVDRNFPG